MLVMRTTEDPTDPIGELIRAQQTLGFDHFALAMNPFGLYGVQPRALLGQKAAYDPHSCATLFDLAVVLAEPASHLAACVPACVVPDEEQELLLADRFELLGAPSEKPGRYAAHGPTIHEPHPRPIELRQVESVTGDGFRVRIVFSDRLLDEAQRLSPLGPAAQGGQRHSAPPAFVLEAGGPLRIGLGDTHQSVAAPFFLSYRGSGEVIQRFARCHLTPRRRVKVARIVSPETRLSTSPSSKLTCAAISSVQRLVFLPNFLAEWWSISLRASALFWSKAARVRFGREEPGLRAPSPRSLKAWMAFRAVWEPHPRLLAIVGGDSPRELARSIWLRRNTKASLERSPASRASRSSFESFRTKIGGFMRTTIAHRTQPT